MASTYLSKTYGSSGNRQRQAISVWVKRAKLADTQTIFWSNGGASYYAHLRFKSDDTLQYYAHNTCNLKTNRKFRDTNAWYHICVTLDTPQATEADRLKIYVNGVAETSFSTASYPSQNAEVKFADDNIHHIGQSDSGSYFDGSMSHFHFVTNTAYDASAFGSTDATTGEWKINTSPSVTYATNSFFVLKDGNSGTDQSGQGNNYSVGGGTLTKTEDCPSNVFATGNPLFVKLGTWSNGNNSIVGSSSTGVRPQMWSTLGAKTGKFYAEAKYTDASGGMVGVSDYTATSSLIISGLYQGGVTGSVGFWHGGAKYINDLSASYGSAWNNNDIIQIALDLDNSCVYFGINGTWQDSGDPTSGSSKTGGITLTNTRDEDWFMSWGDGANTDTATCHVNYGNGYFGTTAVSSAGTNASGNGIFEYDVPTGYTALSTKGLNL